MLNIALNEILAKLPLTELEQTIGSFLEPMSAILTGEALTEGVAPGYPVSSGNDRVIECHCKPLKGVKRSLKVKPF